MLGEFESRGDEPRKQRGMMQAADLDAEYLSIFRDALLTCKQYRPQFGKGRGITMPEFQAMYADDIFYRRMGLDSSLLYSAHRASGGVTSLYRQIGIACERVFRRAAENSFGILPDDSNWSYSVKAGRREKKFMLDARIETRHITDKRKAARFANWLNAAASAAGLPAKQQLHGAVFEVRQGYKSRDSKRQNADIANASSAYAHGYLPVLLLFSSQIDDAVESRYLKSRWVILRGQEGGGPLVSSYDFAQTVMGFGMADFFDRNSVALRGIVGEVAAEILS